MDAVNKYYNELDKLVLLRSEYLSTNSDFYKKEIKKINTRISYLHNILFELNNIK